MLTDEKLIDLKALLVGSIKKDVGLVFCDIFLWQVHRQSQTVFKK